MFRCYIEWVHWSLVDNKTQQGMDVALRLMNLINSSNLLHIDHLVELGPFCHNTFQEDKVSIVPLIDLLYLDCMFLVDRVTNCRYYSHQNSNALLGMALCY